jgi:hypothetical protein
VSDQFYLGVGPGHRTRDVRSFVAFQKSLWNKRQEEDGGLQVHSSLLKCRSPRLVHPQPGLSSRKPIQKSLAKLQDRPDEEIVKQGSSWMIHKNLLE